MKTSLLIVNGKGHIGNDIEPETYAEEPLLPTGMHFKTKSVKRTIQPNESVEEPLMPIEFNRKTKTI